MGDECGKGVLRPDEESLGTLRKLMAATKAEKAYLEIKEQIIKTRLPPGSVVTIAELEEGLNFGRTPIREALKQLQAENLVNIQPRNGIFVTPLSVTDLSKIVEVRVELESLVVRLAAERIVPGQLIELKALSELFRGSRFSNKERLLLLDRKFHCLIFEAAGNRFLQSNLDHYYNLSLRIWYMALPQVSVADINMEDHIKITEAISSGDARRAEQIIIRHIEAFHATLKKYL